MAEPPKGSVTPFASMFPPEEAHKAAKRVDISIAEKQKELDHIKEFIADNTNLINLVSRLPDELHHDVMVPFGKAAFFPGRLIHTNELMVLLGEGYYAERTAKQTVEILKRRGKSLDSQVDSIKANMKDLRAQASFFDSTALEAAEGLVEIREDYEEENLTEAQAKSETHGKKGTVEDDEYDRIMSRLDELEKEELAAEGDDQSDGKKSTVESENENDVDETEDEDEDEDEDAKIVERDNESDEEEQTDAAQRKNIFNDLLSQGRSVCTGLTVQPVPKDDMQNGRRVTQVKKSVPTEKAMLLPEVTERMDRNEALTGSIVEKSGNLRTNLQNQTVTSSQAFTGSIVERAHNLPTFPEPTSISSQASDSQPTKPVSRFKMQRK